MNLISEIDKWLNQTVVVKIRLETYNDHGIYDYALSSIKARYEDDQSMAINVNGQTVKNNIKMYTRTKLRKNDIVIIDNVEWKVLESKELVDEKGNIIYYYIYL